MTSSSPPSRSSSPSAPDTAALRFAAAEDAALLLCPSDALRFANASASSFGATPSPVFRVGTNVLPPGTCVCSASTVPVGATGDTLAVPSIISTSTMETDRRWDSDETTAGRSDRSRMKDSKGSGGLALGNGLRAQSAWFIGNELGKTRVAQVPSVSCVCDVRDRVTRAAELSPT